MDTLDWNALDCHKAGLDKKKQYIMVISYDWSFVALGQIFIYLYLHAWAIQEHYLKRKSPIF